MSSATKRQASDETLLTVNNVQAPVYLIRLQGQPGDDGIRSLRWLLKRLLRGHQLVCVSVSEERAT
jgi:hypothetical protein